MEGDDYEIGAPTQIITNKDILVVSKESNKYISIHNPDFRQKFLNMKYNGKEPYRPRGMTPQTTWEISSVLRVFADPIPNPFTISDIYNDHYNTLFYNSMLNKVYEYQSLNLIY